MKIDYEINNNQLDFYRTKGYLVCRDIFSSEGIKNIIQWTHEIENLPETKGKWMKYYDPSLTNPSKKILTRIENFFDFHKNFKDFFNSKKILNLISKLHGSEIVLFKDKINLKPPGSKGYKAHQDATIWENMYGIKSFISMAVSLDFANLENGCIEVVENKHKEGLLSSSWKEIPKNVEVKLNWTTIQTSPGDVIFFGDYTPHRSADNFSDKSRRLIFLTYNNLSEGDHRQRHFKDKRKNYPPNIEREKWKEYKFHV